MNNRLKFRAWDKESKKFRDKIPVVEAWWDSDCWDDSEQALEDPFIPMSMDSFSHRLVWQQCTGLKDKNNKNIYEGDIVTWDEPHFNKGYVCYLDYYHNDEFYDNIICCFVIQGNWGGSKRYEEFTTEYNYEIIGNIFENPELLNKQ